MKIGNNIANQLDGNFLGEVTSISTRFLVRAECGRNEALTAS
jgi:hypothetical protein